MSEGVNLIFFRVKPHSKEKTIKKPEKKKESKNTYLNDKIILFNKLTLDKQIKTRLKNSKLIKSIPVIPKWKCCKCLFLNLDITDECVICSKGRFPTFHRHSIFQKSAIVLEKWKCSQCCFLNVDSSQECIICTTNRNEDETNSCGNFITASTPNINMKSDTASGTLGWKCSKCQYLNTQAGTCRMCSKEDDINNNENDKISSKSDTDQSTSNNINTTNELPEIPENTCYISERKVTKPATSWTCKQCTLVNNCSRVRCFTCDAPRRPCLQQPTLSRKPIIVNFNGLPKEEPIYAKVNKSKKLKKESNLDPQVSSLNTKDISKSEDRMPVIPENCDPVEKPWTCKNCNFSDNEPSSKTCVACDNGNESVILLSPEKVKYTKNKVEEQWKCVKCTFVNNSVNMTCEICGGSKLISIVGKENTLKKGEFWECAKCTLKNSLAIRRCQACLSRYDFNKERPEKTPLHRSKSNQSSIVSSTSQNALSNTSNIVAPNTPSDNWECPACTFLNEVNALRCTMCHSLPALNNTPLRTPRGMPPRRESELMDKLRKSEEKEARERWIHIIQYCKEVSYEKQACGWVCAGFFAGPPRGR